MDILCLSPCLETRAHLRREEHTGSNAFFSYFCAARRGSLENTNNRASKREQRNLTKSLGLSSVALFPSQLWNDINPFAPASLVVNIRELLHIVV